MSDFQAATPPPQRIPPPLPTLESAERIRQRLAGLIDESEAKSDWFNDVARLLAVQFCASLPRIFGESLDRKTLWERIASGIQSAHAKTLGGDVDLFVQHVCEHIKSDPGRAVADDAFTAAVDALQQLDQQQRQDWMAYLATHAIPVLVQARREWKGGISQ